MVTVIKSELLSPVEWPSVMEVLYISVLLVYHLSNEELWLNELSHLCKTRSADNLGLPRGFMESLSSAQA